MTKISPASKWILEKFVELENDLELNLKSYELAHSINAIYHFLWDNYADWYVEYLKTDDTQIPFAKELFKQFIVLVSPYIPFETEALWKEFFKETELLAFTIYNKTWAKKVLKENTEVSSAEFLEVTNFVSSIRSVRGLFAIDPANSLEVFSESKILSKYSEFIKLVARSQIMNQSRNDLYAIKTPAYEYSIDILGSIKDKDAEIKRTQKLIENLQKQIDGLQKQLENPKFRENADPEIIEEKEGQLKDRELSIKQNLEKIKFLSA